MSAYQWHCMKGGVNPLRYKPITAELVKDTHNLNLFCLKAYI